MHRWLQDVAEDTTAVSKVEKCQMYTQSSLAQKLLDAFDLTVIF